MVSPRFPRGVLIGLVLLAITVSGCTSYRLKDVTENVKVPVPSGWSLQGPVSKGGAATVTLSSPTSTGQFQAAVSDQGGLTEDDFFNWGKEIQWTFRRDGFRPKEEAEVTRSDAQRGYLASLTNQDGQLGYMALFLANGRLIWILARSSQETDLNLFRDMTRRLVLYSGPSEDYTVDPYKASSSGYFDDHYLDRSYQQFEDRMRFIDSLGVVGEDGQFHKLGD